VPAALPKDEGAAQPLSPPPVDEKPATRPMAHSAPMLHSPPSDIEHAEPADPASGRPGRTNWSPARNNEDAAQPKTAISQPDARHRFAAIESAAVRQATSGPNAPAAIYARTLADKPKPSATPANFAISAPQAPAVLAVRIESNEGWNPNPEFRNPLRGAQAATKVSFEDREAPSRESAGDSLSRVQSSIGSEQFDVPDNPLR
jgi:hypothetical protein